MNGAPAAPAPEQHYLPFNGTTGLGFAAGLFSGITNTYTIAAKFAQPMEDGGAGDGAYFSAGGPGASASTQSRYDDAYRPGNTGTDGYWLGYTDAGVHYNVGFVPASIPAGECIIAIKRTATHAKLRVISGGAVHYSNDVACAVHVPDHLAIAAACGVNGVAFTQRAPADFISSLVSSAEVSDAELIAWAAARDARPHVSGIKSYHVASQAVGASISDLGANGVAMALTAASASDLVALQEPVTSYYSSPGGAGDYAEASTNVAARVVFPGASVPVCTVLCWSRNVAQLLRVRDSDNLPMLDMYDGGGAELSVDIFDSIAVIGTATASALPSAASWTHVGYTIDGTDIVPYGNGVADGSSAAIAGTYAASDVFESLIASVGGDVRNIMVIDRALTAGEVAALYAAGATHNPLMPAGVWAGGQSIPVIWCTPAVGGVVANSGDGGTCNLVLSGAVTSEVD